MKARFSVYMGLTILLISACASNQNRYDQISSEFSLALRAGYAEDVLELATKISDKDLVGKDGRRFIELKVEALCLGGNWELAYRVLTERDDRFVDDLVLTAAEGVLALWLWGDDNGKLESCVTEAKSLAVTSLSDVERLLQYYLLLLLGKEEYREYQMELLRTAGTGILGAMMRYDSLDRGKLLQSPPIGFISYKALPSKLDNVHEEWW